MDQSILDKSFYIQTILEDLMNTNENKELEYKSAKGGFPGSFWESYSAFANTEGGIIIFGIAEKKGIFSANPLTEEEVEISNISLQSILAMHPSDITKLLHKMCMQGFLVSSGFGRGTTYSLNTSSNTSLDSTSSDDVCSDSTSSDSTSSDSTSSDSTSLDGVCSDDVCSDDVCSDDVCSDDVCSDDVCSDDVCSDDVCADDVCSDDVCSDSTSSDKDANARDMILTCCKANWYSSREISRRIGRDLIYTRKIITRLVAEGLLMPEYTNLKHPAQRYRTVNDDEN